MADWKVTATTIYCPAVDDEVTVMVYRDFSVKCTGSNKYREPDKETARLLTKKSKRLERPLACPGTDCPQASTYRERLTQEEHPKENPANQPTH